MIAELGLAALGDGLAALGGRDLALDLDLLLAGQTLGTLPGHRHRHFIDVHASRRRHLVGALRLVPLLHGLAQLRILLV